MKDFLYLDNEAVSSISAQLFEGNTLELMYSISQMDEETISDAIQNREGKSTKGSAKLPVASVEAADSEDIIDTKTFNWKNGNTKNKSTKKAYDDFLYTKVYDQLDKAKEIKDIDDSNQFDFIKIDGTFKVIDVKTISNLFDTDLLQKLPFLDTENFTFPNLKNLESIYNRIKKYIDNPSKNQLPKDYNTPEKALNFAATYTGTRTFGVLKELSNHLVKFLGENIIFMKGNTIIIGSRVNTKVPPELLTLTDEIIITGLGRIISDPNSEKRVRDYTQFTGIEMGNSNFITLSAQGVLLLYLTLLLGLNEEDTFEIIQPIGLEMSKVSR